MVQVFFCQPNNDIKTTGKAKSVLASYITESREIDPA